MESFRINYGEFYTDLQRFVEQLPERCSKTVAAAVKDVTLIPTILRPSDQDLLSYNVENVVAKFSVVRELTDFVLKILQDLVNVDSRTWLSEQSRKLYWLMNLVEDSLATVTIGGKGNGPSIVSGGPSSVNMGVRRGMSYDTLSKLCEMTHTLTQLSR